MSPIEPAALTTEQIEALTRVTGAGAAHASEAMTRMTHRPVTLSTPRVHELPIAEVSRLLGGAEALVVALHMKITGRLRGEILISLSPESAGWLMAAILERPITPPAVGSLPAIEESALLEIGNTMGGAYLNALSDACRQSLLVSIPEMAIDMAGAVVDDILAETTRGAASLLVVEMRLAADPWDSQALMLHLPDPATIPQLVTALCREHEGGQRGTAGGA